MRPDIAILSPLGRSGSGSHGGITPVVMALSGALCEAGASVELVTFAPSDPRRSLPNLPADVMLHNLGSATRRRHVQRLKGYLARRSPQALLSAGHRANMLAAGFVGGDTRIVLSVHNALSPGLSRLNRWRRWLRVRELRRAYPQVDAIVCVSNGVAADLGRLVPAVPPKVRVVYNPVALSERDAAAPLHPWLTDRAGPVIVAAGRLTAQKDFATLIRAFAGLQVGPPVRLLILGEGPERDGLLRLSRQLGVADRVALPGFVTNPRAHMAAAALFVLSSAWEGFGNVLVEAMAAGTPVIATDCPSGPREILEDGRFGLLTPVGDAAGLSAAMVEALAAPHDVERLRARAAAFAPAAVAGRYLELLLPDLGR